MAFVASMALTGLFLAPVFMLAGWFNAAGPTPVRVKFNRIRG
jgi:hypothetical protein